MVNNNIHTYFTRRESGFGSELETQLYSNLYPGQPDNLYGFQNFLGLYHDFGFEWDDLRCCGLKGLSGSYKPICQKAIV